MLNSLVAWALTNRLVVFLLTFVLMGVGGYAFVNINVEAYPDPAPAIIEIVAQYPGASAEEVERQVTTPLEVALAGMPGLQTTRTKSLFGLSHLRNQFDCDTTFKDARIEVLNRLSLATLPTGVQPEISPTSPIGEIYRYTLRNPLDDKGQPVYSLSDLKTLQDWTLEREFRRVPRIADVVSFGGQVKRYEIHPDPDRLRRFDITLDQLEQAISDSNLNAGGDYLLQPQSVQVVRGLGLFGDGNDPVVSILTETDPVKARDQLRSHEQQRLHEIRQVVLAATNNVPIRVGDVVEGGKIGPGEESHRGVIASHQTRLGRVSVATPKLDQNRNPIVNCVRADVFSGKIGESVVLGCSGLRNYPGFVGDHGRMRVSAPQFQSGFGTHAAGKDSAFSRLSAASVNVFDLDHGLCVVAVVFNGGA